MRSVLEAVRASLAIVAVCANACSREPPGTLEILASHRATYVDLEGAWQYFDGSTFTSLEFTRLPSEGQFSVRIIDAKYGKVVRKIAGLAILDSGVLTLPQGSPFDDRLHVCRFGTRELLVPERNVGFTRDDDYVPVGRFYARDLKVDGLDLLKGYGPGPDDENHPMRREIEEVDY